MNHEIITGDWSREFDIPKEVATCPSCETKLTAYVDGWTVDDKDESMWIATSVNTDCQTEPLMCLEHGKYLSQSEWMYADRLILDYLNKKYIWKEEPKQGELLPPQPKSKIYDQ